jgi:hypothetical protein
MSEIAISQQLSGWSLPATSILKLRAVLRPTLDDLDAVEVTAFRSCKPIWKKGGLRGEPSLSAPPFSVVVEGNHMQGGPASVVNVLLSENQPLAAIEGAPKNHEKNTNSCKWYL